LMQFGRHISLPFVECIKVCHHLSLHRFYKSFVFWACVSSTNTII
jgi:hypothetical protein